MKFKSAEEVPPLGVCPKCGSQLMRLWGESWDWDHAICSAKKCDYDMELDECTGHDPDGTIYVFTKTEILKDEN